jgi:rod shape-determining protein MreC
MCFWFIYRNNTFHEASFVNSSNKLVGTVFRWKSNVSQYIELQRVNDELSAENERLRNKLRGSFVNVNDHFVMINDTLRERKYRQKSAEVVNNTINKQLNFITINKGSGEGLRPEMGVINTKGLVGIVKNVSEHYSTVIPIINLQYTASAEIKRTGNFGLLKWDGKDAQYSNLNDIPQYVNVQIGDTIVTKGSSSIYPNGVLIGTVAKVEEIEGSNFLMIRVALSNDFSKLRYVYVVENLLRDEQLELEAKTEEDAQ